MEGRREGGKEGKKELEGRESSLPFPSLPFPSLPHSLPSQGLFTCCASPRSALNESKDRRKSFLRFFLFLVVFAFSFPYFLFFFHRRRRSSSPYAARVRSSGVHWSGGGGGEGGCCISLPNESAFRRRSKSRRWRPFSATIGDATRRNATLPLSPVRFFSEGGDECRHRQSDLYFRLLSSFKFPNVNGHVVAPCFSSPTHFLSLLYQTFLLTFPPVGCLVLSLFLSFGSEADFFRVFYDVWADRLKYRHTPTHTLLYNVRADNQRTAGGNEGRREREIRKRNKGGTLFGGLERYASIPH